MRRRDDAEVAVAEERAVGDGVLDGRGSAGGRRGPSPNVAEDRVGGRQATRKGGGGEVDVVEKEEEEEARGRR